MYKYFTYTGSHRWIEVLPRLLTSYNNSVHRSIGVAPSNVNNVNEQEIWQRQQQRPPQKVTQKDKHTVFRVGDHVRLSHARKVFDKGYLPTWTDAVYQISKVIKTPKIDDDEFSGPIQYKVKDYDDVEIEGAFYGFELQKVPPPDRYCVERVIRQRRKRGGGVEYFVKWIGYGAKHNSWVDKLELV